MIEDIELAEVNETFRFSKKLSTFRNNRIKLL